MTSFKHKLHGIQETISRLGTFQTKFRRSAMRKAGNAAAKIALDALKPLAPKQTGTWRKSLGRKVRIYNSGLTLWYGAGPRSAYYAMVTFDPQAMQAKVQSMERRKRDGKVDIRTRGHERGVRVGDIGDARSVRPIKKSKKVADGTLALFWRGRDGKIKAMPLTRKYWPVLYSHLIEKGTKHSKGHHMIERAQKASQAAQAAAMVRILGEEMKDV